MYLILQLRQTFILYKLITDMNNDKKKLESK